MLHLLAVVWVPIQATARIPLAHLCHSIHLALVFGELIHNVTHRVGCVQLPFYPPLAHIVAAVWIATVAVSA